MEVQSKQKHKKRRTRKNLNEIRRRSRTEVKNNVNPSKLHLISKNSNIEQITSKRLTLALFNKTIRSETITRVPLSRADHNISNNYNNAYNGKGKSDIFPTFCKQHENSNNGNSKSILVCKDNNVTTRRYKPEIETSRSTNLDANNTPNSANLFSPLNNVSGDSVSEISSEEYSFKREFLPNICFSSSDIESENCVYEEFMNTFPKYLTDHFPVLSKGFINKNITSLRKMYLEHCHPDSQRPLTCIQNNFTINSPHNYTDSIIQKPMEYIQKGSLCQQSMKKQQKLVISSNSSSLLEFGSISNTLVEDSPEYIYFPHKLNQ